MDSSLALPARSSRSSGDHGPRPRFGVRRWSALAGAGVFTALTLGLPMSAAVAATATATIGISATVQDTCVIAATPLAFGIYTGLEATATASLNVTCTNTTLYTVGLDPGATLGATVATRQMMGGGVPLNYTLSALAAHTPSWGSTVGVDTVAGTGSGSLQTLTVYGLVAAGQYVTPNDYTDIVTATVNF